MNYFFALLEIVKIGQDFEITNVPVNFRNPSSEVNLLLGTKPGHLLVYKVRSKDFKLCFLIRFLITTLQLH